MMNLEMQARRGEAFVNFGMATAVFSAVITYSCGAFAAPIEQVVVCRPALEASASVERQIEYRYQDQIIMKRLMPTYSRVISVDPRTLNAGTFFIKDFDTATTDWVGLDAACAGLFKKVKASRSLVALWDESANEISDSMGAPAKAGARPMRVTASPVFTVPSSKGLQSFLFGRWGLSRSKGYSAKTSVASLRLDEKQSSKMLDSLSSNVRPTSAKLHGAMGSLLISLVPGVRTDAFDRDSAAPPLKQMTKELGEMTWMSTAPLSSGDVNGVSHAANSNNSGDDEIFLEGEALRYLLAPVRNVKQVDPNDFLDQLESVRLTRVDKYLLVTIQSKKSTFINWLEASTSMLYKIVGINSPKTTTFKLGVDDGSVDVWDVRGAPAGPSAAVKYVGLFGDTIYLRKASLDLLTGKALIGLGAFDDYIDVIAEANFQTKNKGSIKWWESIKSNILGDDFDVVPPTLRGEPVVRN